MLSQHQNVSIGDTEIRKIFLEFITNFFTVILFGGL